MKIGEGTEFKVDLKTVISIIVTTSMFVGMYYTLQSDIEEAKKADEKKRQKKHGREVKVQIKKS